jgi:N-acyl-D-aspartate/D-glutamate deacylase
MKYDIIMRGGTMVDGSGDEPYASELAWCDHGIDG